MENKNLVILLIICQFFFGCTEFEGEKIELNYNEGYVKILSNNYVIDSVVVKNHIHKYYVIGLTNKDEGENIIYFKKINNGYTIYSDSLENFCETSPKIYSPGIDVFIRRRGFMGNYRKKSKNDIEYFNYNKIPCHQELIDTIEASNPYR